MGCLWPDLSDSAYEKLAGFLKTVMGFYKIQKIFRVAEELLAFKEGFCLMELVILSFSICTCVYNFQWIEFTQVALVLTFVKKSDFWSSPKTVFIEVFLSAYRQLLSHQYLFKLIISCNTSTWHCVFWATISSYDFGGLVVSMLTSGTQVRRFKPSRSRWVFTGVKILNMPSSGGEVKESVPCPRFAACKRT